MDEKKSILSNLRIKITLYILIGALILSSIIIYVTSHYLSRTLTDSLISQGKIVASSIAELAAERLIEEDVVGLKNILEKYRYYLSNEYIIIVDSEHNIVTDTYNGEVPDLLKDKEVYANFDFTANAEYEVDVLAIDNLEVYDIRFPIKEGLLGFVRVGLKKSFVSEQVRATLLYIGIIIAIGTFAAIVVALIIITLQVTRPVAQLTHAAREISLGNFNTPVKIGVENELQELAAALERMKESLRASLERLKTRSTLGRF